ncbi:haloacid dehalogenase-like hydrolase [Propionimicrobium sp. PCR01-08-3]|uniref:haloacid dehalogenase-like hydrolase n=1 Tax=Propionimicrobium sp. PCR01-08-3 TaxID=3052086 RepID=UPI00255D03B7|nr:haloacid dehalogenase-like hydrolase [Propionimicrobium sp. PCR01-08-3]WIY82121.1 haloacid dehalogenase-like hydrolase [Propionimicrobium sp. PCR01-08-3]
MSRPFPLITTVALGLALGLSACGASSTPSMPGDSASDVTETSASACDLVATDPDWYADNLDRINEMITELGDCGSSGDADGAPLALFDWDNTVVKNDIGDAQTFWMIANGKVKQPAGSDWATVSSYFTDDAVSALNTACGAVAQPGETLPTDTEAGLACADEIIEVYSEGETTGDKEAFQDFNARRMEPNYPMAAQLLAGYTQDEIKEFAGQARDQNINADEGTEQKVGSHEVTGWVRYYDEITNLIEVLNAHGFDVRIISASAAPVAEAWGESLGFTPEKVMGVMTQEIDGKWSSTIAPCGGDDASIPYIEGKRCRVNEEVFGITGAAAFEPAPQDQRQVFGAGDSDTDVTFLSDATYLRLAINRNKTELMCNAYANSDGKWMVNPMFIDPKNQQDEPYECSTKGRIEPDGSTSPLMDADGNVVPDQEDTVF